MTDTYDGGASKRLAFLAIALGLILLLALGFVFAVLPGLAVDGDGLTANERLQRENDARTAGLQALAGVVVALGGTFTAYSVLSNREGQLDERFARSLNLLTSDNLYVVNGAFYSLERIAIQSGFDRPAVVDVLAGFIRDHEPLTPDDKDLRLEVETALAVLERVMRLWKSPTPDLQRTNWTGIALSNRNLAGAFLAAGNFENALLLNANLKDADLSGANLKGALLMQADLRGADLAVADLTDASLDYAKVEGARFLAARYSEKTSFPEGFDPAGQNMRLVPTD